MTSQRNLRIDPFSILLLITLLIMILGATSCATQKKAEKYYKKHPEKLAEKCATTFPVRDSIIKGDTVVQYDTLWGLETFHDTLVSEPQVIVETKTVSVPKLVTKVVTVRDTLIRENTAKVFVLNEEIRKLSLDKTELNVKLTAAEKCAKEAKTRAEKWFWLFVAMTLFTFRKQIIAIISKLIRK